jgi:signal transduction histidine kinase
VDRANEEQARVLADAAHDLANRFHRFHYYTDLLDSALEPGQEAAADLLERLRRTMEEIEALTRGVLSFVRPVELKRMAVSLGDLVTSLVQHAGDLPLEVRVDDEGRALRVDVDPLRISEVLGVVGEAACAAAAGPVIVEVLASGDPLGLRLVVEGSAQPAPQPDLRLARAARIASLHGGSLEVTGGDRLALTLWLPRAASE